MRISHLLATTALALGLTTAAYATPMNPGVTGSFSIYPTNGATFTPNDINFATATLNGLIITNVAGGFASGFNAITNGTALNSSTNSTPGSLSVYNIAVGNFTVDIPGFLNWTTAAGNYSYELLSYTVGVTNTNNGYIDSVGIFTGPNGLTQNAAADYSFSATTVGDTTNVSGSGTFATAVSEPGAAAVLGLGMIGIAGVARRRNDETSVA